MDGIDHLIHAPRKIIVSDGAEAWRALKSSTPTNKVKL